VPTINTHIRHPPLTFWRSSWNHREKNKNWHYLTEKRNDSTWKLSKIHHKTHYPKESSLNWKNNLLILTNNNLWWFKLWMRNFITILIFVQLCWCYHCEDLWTFLMAKLLKLFMLRFHSLKPPNSLRLLEFDMKLPPPRVTGFCLYGLWCWECQKFPHTPLCFNWFEA
jgi:hypothetical protein